MRKILLPLISLTILSCDKDNNSENTNNNNPTNYVLYDNNYYDIGESFYYGLWAWGQFLQISIYFLQAILKAIIIYILRCFLPTQC